MTEVAKLVRAAVVRIVDHGDSTTVIGPQATRRFDGDSAALLRAVLEIHSQPVSRRELLAELAARAGGSPPSTDPAIEPAVHIIPVEPIDQLVELLFDDGVLVAAPDRPPPRPAGSARRVVLGISGAIAAVDAPALIRGLQTAGCDVRVAMTRNATRLVSRAAIEALTHHAVWTRLWQRDAGAPVPHVNLAEWAELVLVCPASASTLSRIATGDCSELVSAIATATRAPVVVVPSMNDAMYESPAVQANLATLRDHGRYVVHPALGIEVAHHPHARAAMLGPAPPAAAVLDIVHHLLRELVAVPELPDGARGWEQLWSSTPPEELPWFTDALDPPLVESIIVHLRSGRRLVDLGTGDGIVAVTAARAGFRVTAIDVAPSALGRARERAERAGAAVALMLDDVTAAQLDASFDVAVDRGLLHCLPPESWPAYAATVSRLVVPGGTLLLVAHPPDTGAGTHTVADDELQALLVDFTLARVVQTMLSGEPAQLFELRRRI